ncbi:MAG TPA: hypothetical protein VJ063_05055 [Verrucomicrobiae bacterium]|nr:hypothetical protein [Verrucomicrobiae bacterium]
MVGGRDIQILLVEPDAAEARRATTILKRARVRSHVTVVPDAGEALTHLRRDAHHYRSPRPNLILLNADSLPHGGEELLTAIKCDGKLGHIPLIMMSNLQTEESVRRAYDLHANCCIHRPMREEELDRVLETTREFWLTIAKLPAD